MLLLIVRAQPARGRNGGSSLLPNSPILTSGDRSADWLKFIYVTDGEIFVMNVDDGERKQLTTVQQTSDGQTVDLDPRWSPDGTKILFSRSTTNANDLHVMNADGTGLTRLFTMSGRDGAWAADGMATSSHPGSTR